jgi:hypothetical protein
MAKRGDMDTGPALVKQQVPWRWEVGEGSLRRGNVRRD